MREREKRSRILKDVIIAVFLQVQVGFPNICKCSDTADFGSPSGTYFTRVSHGNDTREILSSILAQNIEVEFSFTL